MSRDGFPLGPGVVVVLLLGAGAILGAHHDTVQDRRVDRLQVQQATIEMLEQQVQQLNQQVFLCPPPAGCETPAARP